MMKEKIRYFTSYTDDFVTSKNQDFKIPGDYSWIRKGFFSKVLSAVVYGIAVVFGSIYSAVFLHLSYRNKKRMHGALIYGNHTQPIGDIFIPALASLPTRIYVVVSPANYGIPIVGRILPYLGALPLAESISGLRKLSASIEEYLKRGKNIVIYPEAHVWEYCTEIRPFSESSFKFATKFKVPVYCTTTTYKKRRFVRRPKTVVYVDGPFYADEKLSPRDASKKLRDEVYNTMLLRSKMSNCEYIKYKKHKII